MQPSEHSERQTEVQALCSNKLIQTPNVLDQHSSHVCSVPVHADARCCPLQDAATPGRCSHTYNEGKEESGGDL